MTVAVKKRSQSIDMVKGLSIMTLFYLHFENGWMNIDYNIFLVRSPAFYMVVGWLWGMSSNRRTIKEHWAKRLKGLVKPYLWLSMIFLVFVCIMVLIHQFDSFIIWRDLYKTICLRGIGTLWFLPALLGGEMLFLYFRDRSWTMKGIMYFITFMIIVGYRYWHTYCQSSVPYLIELMDAPFRVFQDISNAFIYISIAYYTSLNWGKRIFNASNSKLLVTGILFLILAFCILNFVSFPVVVFLDVMFILGNLCAGYGILFFFKAIENVKLIEKPLAYCGRNSLIIMAFHFCFLLPIAKAIDKSIFHHIEYYGNQTVVCFLIAVVLQVGIIELVNHKFRFIIGK